MATHRPWREAMQDALYGPSGFWLREAPSAHLRTSVTAAPEVYAAAVRELASRVDAALGHPDPFDLVDVAAGRGELLAALPDVPARWRLTGVELAADPGRALRWVDEVPALTGLLFANEWLDDVPLDVLFDGHQVLVDADGHERLGEVAEGLEADWAERWWPVGRRVEVGLTRDRAWAAAVSRLRRGVAVAVDYAHVLGAAAWSAAVPEGLAAELPADPLGLTAAQRMAWGDRRPTLTGFRDGHRVLPVPDGSCDLTAHVAIDACREAGGGGRLLLQREALLALGVDATPPPRVRATADPRGYLAALQRSSSAAELLAPRGLGGFGWLVRSVGVTDPFHAVAA